MPKYTVKSDDFSTLLGRIARRASEYDGDEARGRALQEHLSMNGFVLMIDLYSEARSRLRPLEPPQPAAWSWEKVFRRNPNGSWFSWTTGVSLDRPEGEDYRNIVALFITDI